MIDRFQTGDRGGGAGKRKTRRMQEAEGTRRGRRRRREKQREKEGWAVSRDWKEIKKVGFTATARLILASDPGARRSVGIS